MTSALSIVRLSRINLDNDHTIDLLFDMITSRMYIQQFDVSNCNLKPAGLAKIIDALNDRYMTMRLLNLSYNPLRFDSEFYPPPKSTDRGDRLYNTTDHLTSVEAVKSLIEFLKQAALMNHVNFSGMSLLNAQHLFPELLE